MTSILNALSAALCSAVFRACQIIVEALALPIGLDLRLFTQLFPAVSGFLGILEALSLLILSVCTLAALIKCMTVSGLLRRGQSPVVIAVRYALSIILIFVSFDLSASFLAMINRPFTEITYQNEETGGESYAFVTNALNLAMDTGFSDTFRYYSAGVDANANITGSGTLSLKEFAEENKSVLDDIMEENDPANAADIPDTEKTETDSKTASYLLFAKSLYGQSFKNLEDLESYVESKDANYMGEGGFEEWKETVDAILEETAPYASAAQIKDTMLLSIALNLLQLLVFVMLFFQLISYMMGIAQRYLLAMLQVFLYPLACSTLASADTVGVFRKYTEMFLSNIAVLFIETAVLRICLSTYVYLASGARQYYGYAYSYIFPYFMLLALLRIGRMLDSYLSGILTAAQSPASLGRNLYAAGQSAAASVRQAGYRVRSAASKAVPYLRSDKGKQKRTSQKSDAKQKDNASDKFLSAMAGNQNTGLKPFIECKEKEPFTAKVRQQFPGFTCSDSSVSDEFFRQSGFNPNRLRLLFQGSVTSMKQNPKTGEIDFFRPNGMKAGTLKEAEKKPDRKTSSMIANYRDEKTTPLYYERIR